MQPRLHRGRRGCTSGGTRRDRKAKGPLYVEEVSGGRIVVVESGGGPSEARFDYPFAASEWSGEEERRVTP